MRTAKKRKAEGAIFVPLLPLLPVESTLDVSYRPPLASESLAAFVTATPTLLDANVLKNDST